MKRLSILISAFVCEPSRGSEPGIGWSIAREAARQHNVCVITRTEHRAAIEKELGEYPLAGLRVVYFDVPRPVGGWITDGWALQLHYYLWQLAIYRLMRRLCDEHRFDVVHHVTFGKYWQPTLLARLDVPFLLGPVGGADASPPAFRRDLPLRGRTYERVRNAAIWCGERDPLVKAAVRRSDLALAATTATAHRLRALGAAKVEVVSAIGLAAEDVALLTMAGAPDGTPLRFLSSGRLLHWKGFHLGLRAFAAAQVPDAEYWIVGDGPARSYLQRLAVRLRVSSRVRFWGQLPRQQALQKLACSHVLVHPSLHDSGGYACLEALAAGRPVICLDLAGPALLVREESGFKITASDPARAVRDMATTMACLADDRSLLTRMSEAARKQVIDQHMWKDRGKQFSRFYLQLGGTDSEWAPAKTTDKSAAGLPYSGQSPGNNERVSDSSPLPLVTVVVPTFERPQLLRSALASVIAQDSRGTFRHEVIVVDNASPGSETRQVVEDLARTATVPVRYVREERGVVSYARNRGVHEASGEWIAFCDDDQVAEPDWLFELVAAAREHQAPCVGGTIRLKLPDSAPALSRFCRVLLGEHLFVGAPFVCTGRDIPSGGNLLMARWVFNKVGMFDTELTPGCEDSDYVLRIRNAGYTVLVAPAAVVHHVIPPYRTKTRYLNWVSQRMGAGYAYTDVKKHGPFGVTLLCLARIGLAVSITAPKLAVALLLRDRVADQECRARLWRLVGYAQQTAALVGPKRAGDLAFSRALEFRRERVLFGTVTGATPDSKHRERL